MIITADEILDELNKQRTIRMTINTLMNTPEFQDTFSDTSLLSMMLKLQGYESDTKKIFSMDKFREWCMDNGISFRSKPNGTIILKKWDDA